MLTLRPYQIKALNAILTDLNQEQAVLLQAPTGSGKTIIFAEAIRRWLGLHPEGRVTVVAHRQELITQARDKIVKVWPEGAKSIGLACASLGTVDVRPPVVIGSVQTLARRQLMESDRQLLIIDEAHHVPGDHSGGQYHGLIGDLLKKSPGLRVLGVTATPFRLGHGYIYGSGAKEGNIFPRLNFKIELAGLMAEGYLAPFRAREGLAMAEDLKRVKITRGEYDQRQLSDLLLRRVHIESAVTAYEKYGEGRTRVLIFAVSIEHARRLAEAFNQAGYRAAAVHSQMSGRERILADFEAGGLKVLINIGVLTEGWDSPAVDLILLCRPTKSAALFVQMIGRGSRPHPGKKDFLVLDLAENFKTHGDPAEPRVVIPAGGVGPAPYKVCPNCRALLAASRLSCPDCGHKWEVILVDKEATDLARIRLAQNKFTDRILDWSVDIRLSPSGRKMLVLTCRCEQAGNIEKWLDVEGHSPGLEKSLTQALWVRLSGGRKAPETLDEAVNRLEELNLPETVTVINRSGFMIIRELA
jgi:DNA repair protein RadD